MKHTWLIVVLLGICLPVVGLAEEQVEVLRNPWGVPHVFASTEEAGFFGFGYATTEDRRLPMELVRRKGAGRLAEVCGPEWVQSDRESRIHGLPGLERRGATRRSVQPATAVHGRGTHGDPATAPCAVGTSRKRVVDFWSPTRCTIRDRLPINDAALHTQKMATTVHPSKQPLWELKEIMVSDLASTTNYLGPSTSAGGSVRRDAERRSASISTRVCRSPTWDSPISEPRQKRITPHWAPILATASHIPPRIPVYNMTRRKSLGLFTPLAGKVTAAWPAPCHK